MNKVLLIIMDGWGIAPAWGGNAIEMAQTPNIDSFYQKYPKTTLKAAEEAVGLPHHENGNSEVGHLNIGCGQVVNQNLPGITALIENGEFFQNETIINAINHAKTNKSNLHLMGLFSDGGVHSHSSHLLALIKMVKENNLNQVYIHIFTDGRDTDPMSSLSYISKLEIEVKTLGIGKIETISGRYYAMDRDKHWDRIEKTYDAMVLGSGPSAGLAQQAISENYRQNRTDEFIVPTVITSQASPFVPVSDNDAIIFFNFRADRAREITAAFTQENFSGFNRKKIVKNLYFATFSFLEDYVTSQNVHPAFNLKDENYPLAKALSENKIRQLHIAETEKYAHVTFFFNGGLETPFSLEQRIMVTSPKVKTFDLKPEMSAKEIEQKVIDNLGKFEFIVCNFANADMVGHSGNIKATIKACETVDACVGKITQYALQANYTVIVTADHGNAEQMINPNSGEPYTEHTTSPVPFVLISNDPKFNKPLRQENGEPLALKDIAPTVLEIMNLPKPKDMSGKSLLQN